MRRVAFLATLLVATAIHAAAGQTESLHRSGPNGLEAWTLLYPIDGQGDLPMQLVIARHDKVLETIKGDSFVWKWIFLKDGEQVAYEAGPLHFSLACVLFDIKNNRELARFDCYPSPLPGNAPDWVTRLESSKQPNVPETSAQVTGTVVDVTGAAISGATIYTRSRQKSLPAPLAVIYRGVTDRPGTVHFASSPGLFDVVVFAPGFTPWGGVLEVKSGRTFNLRVRMSIVPCTTPGVNCDTFPISSPSR